MILSRFQKSASAQNSDAVNNDPAILIVEDDDDQLELMASVVIEELEKILEQEANGDGADKLKSISVVKVRDRHSLERATLKYQGVFLTVLDCNIPDRKGGAANDQFVKQNHILTGQHKSVDVLIKNAPNKPILLVSSQKRFRNTVTRHYGRSGNVPLKFVSKEAPAEIRKQVSKHVQDWLMRHISA